MVKRKQSLFVLIALMGTFSFAGPPTDQGFWNFFKEGIKDDLTLIRLGMHAGLRVMIPGYAEIEDMVVNGYDTDDAAGATYAIGASGADQLKEIVKDSSHPLNTRAKELLKAKNIKPKNLTKASKGLSKFAGGLDLISKGLDTYSELQNATLLAMEYQKSREAEYEQMRKRSGSFPDPLVRECPKKVRIEVRSRALGPERSDAMDIAKDAFPAARHDHVFVYNAETGELVDDIGWSDDYGGSGFRDYGNFGRYGQPIRTLEMPGNIYYDVRNAFVATSKHFGYQLFNDATVRGPFAVADAALSIGLAEMKCMSGFSKEKILETLLCSIFALAEGQTASDELTGSDSYNRPGFDPRDKRLLVNCQLWARMFLDALEAVAALAQSEDELPTDVAPASAKPEEKQPKQPEPKEEKHPCLPCFFGDLCGECSDPNCPNYGNPHSAYKGGGMPAFGR
ncbi:MAG: hypothetical protein IKO40_04460 [Kiritimatiellae bacterium]|nr:hypothetical protein [Kiritimatiellia bacterium]